MKTLVCEMCGNNDLIKQDGVFVCQYCGTKYSLEEARKMMIEGTVDVSGSIVKVDTSDELENLYTIAHRAKDANNNEKAAKYYDMILVKDPTSWEASFYSVYFVAINCKSAEISSAANSVSNCLTTVLQLIKDNVADKDKQIEAVKEVASRCVSISSILYDAARKYCRSRSGHTQRMYIQEWHDNIIATYNILYTLGDGIDQIYGNYPELRSTAVDAWKGGIIKHKLEISNNFNKASKDTYIKYSYKIAKYDPSYPVPKSGCYVATAVYGSYDCPQVWTLRRYRDYTLAETWYGRIFIHTYYAISPTIVKLFGNKTWFKKMWKGKLDKMIADLQSKGVENTPYIDREW